MVQKVQQQNNWYQNPNIAEGIWYVERRLSYKTQIRDKEWWSVATSIINLSTSERAQTWSSYTTIDTVDSSSLSSEITTATWWKIYSSTWGTYLISYLVKSMNAGVTSFKFSSRNMVQAVYVVDAERPWERWVFTALAKLNPNDYIRSSFLPVWNSCNPKVTMTMVRLW